MVTKNCVLLTCSHAVASTMSSPRRSIVCGKKFSSFAKVRQWVSTLSGNDFHFSIATSTTIEKTKVKGPFREGLKYYEVYYRCSRAGKFQSKGKGNRDCKSKKTNCPAKITLRAKDKQSLEITDFVKEHCHEEEIHHEMSESPSTAENGINKVMKGAIDQPWIVVKKRHRPSDRLTGWTGPISPAVQETDDDSMQIDDPDYVPVSGGMDFEASTEAASRRKKRTCIQEPKVVDARQSEESQNSSIENSSDEEETIEPRDCKNKKKSTDGPAITRKQNKTASMTPEESYSLIEKQVDDDSMHIDDSDYDPVSDETGVEVSTEAASPPKKKMCIKKPKVVDDSKSEESRNSSSEKASDEEETIEPRDCKNKKKSTDEPAITRKQNKTASITPEESYSLSKKQGSQVDETPARNSLSEPGTSLQKKVIFEDEHENNLEPKKKNKKGRPPKTGVIESKSRDKAKPRKFVERNADVQVKLILSWLLKTDRLIAIEKKEKRGTKGDLKLDQLRDAFIDEDVDIKLIKSYIDTPAFKALKAAITKKKKINVWTCEACNGEEIGSCKKIIRCDSCLQRYHIQCAALKRRPSAKQAWFCMECNDHA